MICPKSKGGGESHRCNQAILWLLVDGGDAILEEFSHQHRNVSSQVKDDQLNSFVCICCDTLTLHAP